MKKLILLLSFALSSCGFLAELIYPVPKPISCETLVGETNLFLDATHVYSLKLQKCISQNDDPEEIKACAERESDNYQARMDLIIQHAEGSLKK